MNQIAMNRHENNMERGPFQRNGRSNNNRTNTNGYQSWKSRGGDPYNKSMVTKPKEKVLTADDFPALPSLGAAKPKGVWAQKEKNDKDTDSVNDITLADRVKEVMAKEEAAQARGRVEEENDESLYAIPISDWIRKSYLAKKHQEEMKRRAYEEEEDNYRWQMSTEMFPPKEDPPIPEFDDELEEDGQSYEEEDMEELRD